MSNKLTLEVLTQRFLSLFWGTIWHHDFFGLPQVHEFLVQRRRPVRSLYRGLIFGDGAGLDNMGFAIEGSWRGESIWAEAGDGEMG